MSIKETYEMEMHIKELYEKLRPLAEKEGIFKPITFHFATTTPHGAPGDFCYSDGDCYYYGGIGDRGAVTLERTKSLFEVAYWIFEFQTSAMAFEYEKKHRIMGQSYRRIAFAKQLELMGLIGEDYRQRAELEINKMLKEHPFQDELFR